jgi:hypothetical protein
MSDLINTILPGLIGSACMPTAGVYATNSTIQAIGCFVSPRCPTCGQTILSYVAANFGYPTPPQQDPGIYWERSGGKTWRVTIVRE